MGEQVFLIEDNTTNSISGFIHSLSSPLRCTGTPPCFSVRFAKGNNIYNFLFPSHNLALPSFSVNVALENKLCDFLFASLDKVALPK